MFVHPFHLGVLWLLHPDPVVWHVILKGDRALPSGVGPAGSSLKQGKRSLVDGHLTPQTFQRHSFFAVARRSRDTPKKNGSTGVPRVVYPNGANGALG